MSVVKASWFTSMKARVKAEVLRRNQSGSVAAYGGSAYDYTVAPAAGKTVRAEHRDKLVTPMRAVNSDMVPASAGAVIKASELANLDTRITAWSARSMTDQSGSDCKSGCTGTCYTGCATGCGSGCETGCTGCSGGCEGCGGNCSGYCGGCDGTCHLGCTDECTKECIGSCRYGCLGSCEGSCSSACGKTCSNGCGGSSVV